MKHILIFRFLLPMLILTLGLAAQAWADDAPKPPAPPLKIVYFTPSDCTPLDDRQERLGRVMKNVQDFYRDGMTANGYGPMTFNLEWETPDKLKLYMVKGKKKQLEYGRNDASVVRQEVRDALLEQGINIDREVIVIFQQLLNWDGDKATEIGPYVGGGSHLSGTGWVYEDKLLDPDLLASKEPGGYYHGPCSQGQFNTHYIGGTAHELGHGFSLPHDCELAVENEKQGNSLMGSGNHTYGKNLRNEGRGTFLSASSALRLSKVRAFAGDLPRANDRGTMQLEELTAEYKNGDIILTGRVKADPPLAGMIAYNDNEAISSDYDAKSWVAPVDKNGNFRVTITELIKTPYQLRLVGVHENGASSRVAINYEVGDDGPDLSPINAIIPNLHVLQLYQARDKIGLQKLVARLKTQRARNAASVDETLFRKAQHALKLLNAPTEFVSPADVPAKEKSFAVSQAKFSETRTGWGRIQRDQVPESVFLSVGGEFSESGLYAHAESLYKCDLGGKWSTLKVGFGLQDGNGGSVVFVVRGDGKELFRSELIRNRTLRQQEIDVKNVKTLELIVENGGDGNGSDWAVWAAPTLER